MKKLVYILLVLVISACNQTVEKSSMMFSVEGMSCSHSCAPYIQKNLNKLDGVLETNVSFESKSAKVTFNIHEISQKEIIQKIESLADGQYKVGIVTSLNSPRSSSSQSKEGNDTDFDITKPDLAHSTGFQLPNLFSLLNSLLH